MHPRIGVLLDGLRAHGDDVLELDVPLGVDTAGRVAMLNQPWRLPRLALRLMLCWLRLAIRGRRTARHASPDAVVVGYLGHFDVHLARLLFGRTPIALDQLIFAADTARDRGISSGWKNRLLGRLDRSAVSCADLAVVDTPEHQAIALDQGAGQAVVAPIGASTPWFAAAGSRQPADDRRPLRVVFFGLFTPLQGAPVLGRALSLLPDSTNLEVLMIGRGQDYAATRALTAAARIIQWRDWVPADELPKLISSYDVCLGIFGDGPKALRVVPNKVYQGAAAGCAILTSDTEPQRRTLGDAAAFVPPGDGFALGKELRALVDDRARVHTLQQAARDLADTTFRPEIVVRPLRDQLLNLTGHSLSRN
jgi:glycosyltransferase involved in cell wall biosynthesis